jgi:hypothetical protein
MKQRIVPMLGLAAAVLLCTLPALGQEYEGTPAKTGQVSLKYGTQDLSFKFVEGGFQQMQSFTMATLVFKPEAKAPRALHLNISLMYQAPGKLDMDGQFSMNGVSMFQDGDVSRFTKGKSKCTITLTKATPTEVEGILDCPFLHDISGKVAMPLSNVKFYATTK